VVVRSSVIGLDVGLRLRQALFHFRNPKIKTLTRPKTVHGTLSEQEVNAFNIIMTSTSNPSSVPGRQQQVSQPSFQLERRNE
jgi:hypothetical protein